MKVYGIIPARYGSTRLPAKVLADIAGRPLIQHVYERARRSPSLDRLVVATDDDRVFQRVKSFGGEVVKTSPAHPSGTDRVAEAARILEAGEKDLVVNIQGDQPLFESGMIDEIVSPFREDAGLEMGALVYPILREEELANPSVVKVVADRQGFALYFSRSPIPFVQTAGIDAAILQAYRSVCLPPGFFAGVYPPAAGNPGANRIPGTAAGARTRAQDPDRGDPIRLPGGRYAGGSGKSSRHHQEFDLMAAIISEFEPSCTSSIIWPSKLCS